MGLIDTHCHLYLEDFDPEQEQLIEEAKASGIERLLMPNVDLTTIDRMHALCDQHPDFTLPMMGFHPTSVDEHYAEALRITEQWLGKRTYCAIGEIGIDLHESPHDADRQMRAFDAQCRIALDHGLPVNIHCRDGLDEALEVLRGLPQMPSGAFHCFGGSVADVEKIRSAGDFYFGINGIVTFKNSGLRSTQ